MKPDWVTVLEFFIAGILLALFWSFLEGPVRRLSHMLHNYNHEGKYIPKGHPDYEQYQPQAAA